MEEVIEQLNLYKKDKNKIGHLEIKNYELVML